MIMKQPVQPQKEDLRGPIRRAPVGPGLWVIGPLIAALLLSGVRLFAPPTEYAVCSKENGIYTVDEVNPQVECLVVRGSRIASVGSLANLRKSEVPAGSGRALTWIWNAIRPRLEVLHVRPGAIVVPGLADAHAHTIDYGFKMELELDGTISVDDVLERVKTYITSHEDVFNDTDRWVGGMGWDQTEWPGGKFPTAADFDREPLLRNRPIVLKRVDCHAIWVSSKVLQLSGKLPDEVDGGIIVRDGGGEATGIFVDNAMSLIHEPPWTEQQMKEFFDRTMKDALAHGLTSIHDASASPQVISFYKKLAEAGELPIRLYLMGNVLSDEYWGSQIQRLIHHGKDGLLNVRGVKLFADGALGSWGAALLEPYSDNPDTSGLMLSTPTTLEGLVNHFWKDGWQVNIHGIGDRANNVILDILEDIIERQGANATEWRPRIEHAQIMTLKDLERAGRLGVIASVQPTHATSDMWYAENRLGPERIKGAYAYHTLLNVSSSNILPLGSDFPVEGINPLLGFYAAVSRLSIDGKSPHGTDGWFPEQRLSRAQALKGMTLDAAYASFAENELGSITPGKKADFVVMDRDIMMVDMGDILLAKVLATVVDGRVVYGKL